MPCALISSSSVFRIFFFNGTATTEIYTLSLHDALPISSAGASFSASDSASRGRHDRRIARPDRRRRSHPVEDRKSTRLNSSHLGISYAVFCLKKKNTNEQKVRTATRAITKTT